MRSPVLLLIYRRPELTAKVMSAIRQARPEKLWIAADAPHPDRAEEQRLCAEARAMALDGIDWPCEVATRFSDEHLGCRKAVSKALEWAFTEHERLIILEDDCIPDFTFFQWCDELLEKYAHEPRIMQICGSNLSGIRAPDGMSGNFSRFGPIWGWATWRRAWQLYDVEIKTWPDLRDSSALKQLCPEPFEAEWRREVFDSVYFGRLDTWDYQWAYARMVHGMLSVFPTVNLIQNIGFGDGATHTISSNSIRLSGPAVPLQFPIVLPQEVTSWLPADRAYLHKVVGLPSTYREMLAYWLRKRIKQLLSRAIGTF